MTLLLLALLMPSVAGADSLTWHWTEPVRVDTFSNDTSTIQCQFTGNRFVYVFGDTVLVAFVEWYTGLWIARSIDRGESFAEFIDVPGDDAPGYWSAQIINSFSAPTSMEYHITCYGNYTRTTDGGRTWLPALNIMSLSSFDAGRRGIACGATREGMVYLAGPRRSWYSSDHGLNFTAVTGISGEGPDLICYGDTVFLSYWQFVTYDSAFFKWSTDRGTSWQGGNINMPYLPYPTGEAHWGNDFALAGSLEKTCIVWGSESWQSPHPPCLYSNAYIVSFAGISEWPATHHLFCFDTAEVIYSGSICKSSVENFLVVYNYYNYGGETTVPFKLFVLKISSLDGGTSTPFEIPVLDNGYQRVSVACLEGDTSLMAEVHVLEYLPYPETMTPFTSGLFLRKIWFQETNTLNVSQQFQFSQTIVKVYDLLGHTWELNTQDCEIIERQNVVNLSYLPSGVLILFGQKRTGKKIFNLGGMR